MPCFLFPALLSWFINIQIITRIFTGILTDYTKTLSVKNNASEWVHIQWDYWLFIFNFTKKMNFFTGIFQAFCLLTPLSAYLRGDIYTHFVTQNVNLTFYVGRWVKLYFSSRYAWEGGSKENPNFNFFSKEKI